MDSTRSGSCACGAVRFTTHGSLRGVIFCHCVQCRKQTGHFYAATSVAAADLHVEGADEVTWYASSPHARRGFCRTCGSALFWQQDGADVVSILAGAFDDPAALEGQGHIFVEQKADYYDIADGLPQNKRW